MTSVVALPLDVRVESHTLRKAHLRLATPATTPNGENGASVLLVHIPLPGPEPPMKMSPPMKCPKPREPCLNFAPIYFSGIDFY